MSKYPKKKVLKSFLIVFLTINTFNIYSFYNLSIATSSSSQELELKDKKTSCRKSKNSDFKKVVHHHNAFKSTKS